MCISHFTNNVSCPLERLQGKRTFNLVRTISRRRVAKIRVRRTIFKIEWQKLNCSKIKPNARPTVWVSSDLLRSVSCPFALKFVCFFVTLSISAASFLLICIRSASSRRILNISFWKTRWNHVEILLVLYHAKRHYITKTGGRTRLALYWRFTTLAIRTAHYCYNDFWLSVVKAKTK